MQTCVTKTRITQQAQSTKYRIAYDFTQYTTVSS